MSYFLKIKTIKKGFYKHAHLINIMMANRVINVIVIVLLVLDQLLHAHSVLQENY